MLRYLSIVLLVAPAPLVASEPADVPAFLLEIPEGVDTVLVAESSTSTLHEFKNGAHGLERSGQMYMSVGQRGVGKQRAWDRKTPLGIYFVNEQLDTSKLHEKYGPTAFPLDYPNIWDRRNGRSGDGIWIHGVAPGDGQRPPLDTDGCIALGNDDLLALAGRLQPLVTPVLVAREVARVPAADVDALRDELRRHLDVWAASLAAGDLHRLLSLYADDFTYRGMARDEWAAFRLQALEHSPAGRVDIDRVLLLADPEEQGLYLSRFELRLYYKDRTVVVVKRLYWRRIDHGVLKIVAEDNA